MSYFGNRYLGKDAYRFSIYENEQLKKLIKAKLLRKSIVRRIENSGKPATVNRRPEPEKPAA